MERNPGQGVKSLGKVKRQTGTAQTPVENTRKFQVA